MDKQKKEQLILLITVVIFVIMLPRLVFRQKQEARVPLAGHEVAGEPAQTANFKPEAEAKKPAEAMPEESVSKDPFEIPADALGKLNIANYDEMTEGEESEKIPGVDLQGFVWGGDSPVAFINDKVYKKGDSVGDAQILGIDKKGVYFLYNGNTIIMRVKK